VERRWTTVAELGSDTECNGKPNFSGELNKNLELGLFCGKILNIVHFNEN
jgi:hypothetical protein